MKSMSDPIFSEAYMTLYRHLVAFFLFFLYL